MYGKKLGKSRTITETFGRGGSRGMTNFSQLTLKRLSCDFRDGDERDEHNYTL